MNINITNSLSLCEFCGGTGIDPDDSSRRCPKCDGTRVINHLGATFEINKPYYNEQERFSDQSIISTNIKSIITHLLGGESI